MKSISKAAQYLHVTQPTLSSRLRKAEDILGFPLFERDWKGVKLTRQGAYFLPYAIQLLQGIDSAQTVLSDLDYLEEGMRSYAEVTNRTNCLYIGIDSWLHPLFVSPIIDTLNAQFPDLKYRFVTQPSQTIYDLLEFNGIHCGIYYGKNKQELEAKTLIEDEMVLIYRKEDGIEISSDLSNIDLLKKKPFILFDNPVLIYHSHITKAIIQLLSIEQFQIVDDYHVMLNYIEKGISYTVIPKSSIFHFIDSVSFPLEYIPLGDRVPKIKICISRTNAKQFTKPMHYIKDIVIQYIENEYIREQ